VQPFRVVCARTLAVAICLALGWPGIAEAKRKDDRVVLSNGDQLVGEIKSLAQGALVFKAEYMLNNMSIDWRLVRELHSQDEYHLKLGSGLYTTGTMERRDDGSFVINQTVGQTVTTVWQDVIAMLPAETSFWAQLTGSINSGFSYTSGVNQTQFSASGDLSYTTNRYTFVADGSSTFSGQEDGSTTSRNTLTILNSLTLRPKVFGAILTELLNSQQQDLTLRTTVGGAIGRWLILTDKRESTVFAGVVYTHEQYSAPPDPSQPGSQVANNVEGVLGFGFNYFRFKTVDITSRLSVYPSLTTLGRVRLNYAPTLSLEIARNLYWNFTLYENYDSQPPVNANKNDFGITNSIGWKF
jgi:hypothetical protein